MPDAERESQAALASPVHRSPAGSFSEASAAAAPKKQETRRGRGRGARLFKVIVIGDSGVGKTCLTFRFCNGRFPVKSEATIGVDFREKVFTVGDELIKLQLWDTAGQERFRKSMVAHYYRNVHAVVFVYDVTKLSSFESLPIWVQECNRHQLTYAIPRILVGNKCDIAAGRVVDTARAQKFADLHNMPLFETSAKDDSSADHVESIFMTLAHKLKNARPMMPEYNMRINLDSLAGADASQHSADLIKDSCLC